MDQRNSRGKCHVGESGQGSDGDGVLMSVKET